MKKRIEFSLHSVSLRKFIIEKNYTFFLRVNTSNELLCLVSSDLVKSSLIRLDATKTRKTAKLPRTRLLQLTILLIIVETI